MSTRIPDTARALVKQRARFRCERCGVPNPNGEVHHRRSRLVRDFHQHCPCNLIFLCPVDHQWAHANPFEARKEGLIMSKFVTEPTSVALATIRGLTTYDCTGGAVTT